MDELTSSEEQHHQIVEQKKKQRRRGRKNKKKTKTRIYWIKKPSQAILHYINVIGTRSLNIFFFSSSFVISSLVLMILWPKTNIHQFSSIDIGQTSCDMTSIYSNRNSKSFVNLRGGNFMRSTQNTTKLSKWKIKNDPNNFCVWFNGQKTALSNRMKTMW